MAEYSIILNLGGNAVTKSAQLAANLEKAVPLAQSLSTALRGMSQSSQGMTVLRAQTHAFRRELEQANRTAAQLNRTLAKTRMRGAGVGGGGRGTVYTRHKSNQVLSYGTGFSIGGFSARLSSIFQPDENGNILGMNAQMLAKRLNIGAIIGSAVWSVVKAGFKLVKWDTIAQYGAGVGINAIFSRLLMSEGMSEGVRIVQRRRQARLGLGESYEQANKYADELAASYGLERSTALSSVNVLAGMTVGKTGEKLTLANAAALTRVGGLISQQAGVSFERVMTNIQQLMTQSNPNIRDIRELLNQAPILGRYAIDEMERRGVTGVDKNAWLKDQANLMSVLQRYDVENMSSPIMQARGMVTLAQQDFFAKLAENRDWVQIAHNTATLLNTLADSISNLLSAFSNSSTFQASVNAFTLLVEKIGTNADSITTFTGKMKDFLAQYGLDIGDTETGGYNLRLQQEAIMAYWKDERVKAPIRERYFAEGGAKYITDPKLREEAFEQWYQGSVVNPSLKDFHWAQENIELLHKNEAYGITRARVYIQNGELGRYVLPAAFPDPSKGRYAPDVPSAFEYLSAYADPEKMSTWIAEAFKSLRGATELPKFGEGGTSDDGSNINGYNRDRRSLVINFNAPIVKWDSTINTDDPQEVVNEVADTIEGGASRAIQIALLGASQKMNTRWG